MKPRPTIFLSGVSQEFGTFRDAVENEIEKKGCFAENQPGFAPDYRTVEEMLTRRLTDSDAVIHIVGFRFGAEPNQRPAGAPRRSYTQMEFDIARKLDKPVYVFISEDATVRDDAKPDDKPEDTEAEQLQLAHRGASQRSSHLYYLFQDKAELCKLVAEIPPVQAAGFQADISRIDRYAPAELIGREAELAILSDAWAKVRKAESPRHRVITFVALGGEGKTSLLAKWAADLAHQNWPGCDAVFAWSFYSQGTREQTAASSDLFLKEALVFFGDPAMASSAQGAFEKGRRLAQLVGERRALLILDGLEPLQYGPTSPMPGELKDPGLAALLKGLAANSRGLCVVTTRYSIPDLRVFWQTTAPEVTLARLSKEAGVELMRRLGVKGTQQEFETLVEDVKGHALSLNLLGTYLRDAHAGDIRRRDVVRLEEADTEEQGGHAFRVMDAYAKSLANEGDKGKRALALLSLLGVFDRPATADCLAALQKAPAIAGLTETLVGMSEPQRNIALTRLEAAKLLTVNRDAAGTLLSLDAHPLLREYFARQLRTQQPEAWRAAHRRLYGHLCAITPDKVQPTLEDLQPVYQAVAHGCQAGLYGHALKVYEVRILRRSENYSITKLGAFSADLGALTWFFEEPWSRVTPSLGEDDQSFLLNCTGFCLHSSGRLAEAVGPMRDSMNLRLRLQDWKGAAASGTNLNVLTLELGDIGAAVRDAEQFVASVEVTGNLYQYQRMYGRPALGNALLHAGRWEEAEQRFREAEEIQRQLEPQPLLYWLQGFQYCDLLLTSAERAAWQMILSAMQASSAGGDASTDRSEVQACGDVAERATQTLRWALEDQKSLQVALDRLTLGCAALYAAILESSDVRSAGSDIAEAVTGLRQAGQQQFLPLGLLTRALLRFLEGDATGAQSDLDEAWDIAERGPMPLFQADIHLHRARLFQAVTPYTWESPRADLAEARRLIEKHGYWRRKEELEDAEAAIFPRRFVAAC